MGGCAGKLKDQDVDEAPAPVEAPATPAAPEKTESETVPQVITLFDRVLIYYSSLLLNPIPMSRNLGSYFSVEL